MAESVPDVGSLLREWRGRRRLTQMGLAEHAEISAKHLSFIETGRSHPSRQMLLRLAERLQLRLRERNILLNAGGFAAVYSEGSLADPAFEVVRKAIDIVLAAFAAAAPTRLANAATSVAAPKLSSVHRLPPGLV